MIEVQDKSQQADVFDDAVHATAFIATVHVREGELMLPQRIREHLADGPVVVHLMRGQDDVAAHTATLTSRSTLTGIVWPEDVKPRTSLTVLCPRGAASHDVGVLLPDLAEPVQNETAADAPQTAADAPNSEPVEDVAEPMSDREADALAFILGELAAVEQATAETELPGPAEYTIPTDLPAAGVLELPDESAPGWPGDVDLAAGETTETFTAVLVPVVPDFAEAEPGTVFSAALVAVRTPPMPKPQRGWLERHLRLAARWTLDRSWTATRIAVATASGLVLAGAGLGYLVQLAVTW